jgi:hypothetical protein
VQQVATNDAAEQVHDKFMSNARSQSVLTGGEIEAQERFTMSGDPRSKQAFLAGPYALGFWNRNADLRIKDE